jgi:NAD(P)H-dependent flavin oxidoreductase YrpB (nitropropane dioxygenase family)
MTGEATMETPLTRRLGIRYPIVSAGMARVAQGGLVVAVSNAGGMGCLGGVSYDADALRHEIRWIRERTEHPFAVDLLVPPSLTDTADEAWQPVRELWQSLSPADRDRLKGIEPLLTPGVVQAQVEVVLEERPPVVAITFDVPEWFVQECHARDMQVMALVGSVRRAREAAAAGVDYIVAQGTEGGGHTGHVGTMALVPAVVDAVEVPVLAAGGIADGRGVAAALCLGAAGAWVGTRFIASEEAYGHPGYKGRVLQATSRDTILSTSYTGKSLRTLRNEWTDSWASRTQEVSAFPAQYAVAGTRVETGYQDGDVRSGMMPAGQGVDLITRVLPAHAIVDEMVSDARRLLAGWSR